jgi:uncharacterized protein
MKQLQPTFLLLLIVSSLSAQTIGTFTSVQPTAQTQGLVLPSTHRFQIVAQTGDALTGGGSLMSNPDFTAYVPISGSSTNGYVALNHETAPGGVTIFDVNYNASTKLWQTTSKIASSMVGFAGTAANCSGAITPWGTVLSGEEAVYTSDIDGDSYNDLGWLVEVNPVTRQCFRKIWAAGCTAHENAVVASNGQYLYYGADDPAYGYLYKYVFTTANDPTAGTLYVLKITSGGNGDWVQVPNTSKAERNGTQAAAAGLGATNISGIEDVEIGPDGKIYLAAKWSQKVMRLTDNGSTVSNYETYMDATDYPINYGTGTVNEPYAYDGQAGNDNLAFDGEGNLWICQDGGRNHIWVVSPTHTPGDKNGVRLFATTPAGSESTGLTFTPDYKFMFISMQHPSGGNTLAQTDAAGNAVTFNRGTTLIIARSEFLGTTVVPINSVFLKAKAIDNQKVSLHWDVEIPHLKGLELERSIDGGKSFESIFSTKMTQNTPPQYPSQFLDDNPNVNDITFYRLKAAALDGDYSSSIVSILIRKDEFSVFPNPCGNRLSLKFMAKDEEDDVELTIYNRQGQMVFAKNLADNFVHHVDIGHLPDGAYTVQIKKDGRVQTKPVLKIGE